MDPSKNPDKNDPDCLQHLHSTIARIPEEKGAHLWVSGDFNIPDIDGNEENVTPYASSGSACNQLLTINKDACIPGSSSNTAYQDHEDNSKCSGSILHEQPYSHSQGGNNTRHRGP